jgi:hypothetical protein
MDFIITALDRSTFKRCRRQWDFGSPHRRDLEPRDPADLTLESAIKDALAIYYYPGTWDWPRQIVLPLVYKGFERAVQTAHPSTRAALTAAGKPVLQQYIKWAATLDDFAPIRIDHDVDGLVADPVVPDRGLVTHDGLRILYAGRVDLLAVDATDTYWVVRHQVVRQWQDLESLVLDEEAVAGCWAWEQAYLGMEIAGTIHNEIRTEVYEQDDQSPDTDALEPPQVAQHEASGGGRSIPQHRRLYARGLPTSGASRVEQRTAGSLRRTLIRRSRAEIADAGRLIGEEALAMSADRLAAYPTPGAHCQDCAFATPCLALAACVDPTPALAGFRRRPAAPPKPRLGQSTWGFGRGAAPPDFQS